jgi:hypothetical protein
VRRPGGRLAGRPWCRRKLGSGAIRRGLPLTISASPEQQGAVGMAPRMTKAFAQRVKCADPVVFAVAKRRLAPMSNEVWSVRRLPLRLVYELGREPVLGGSRPPTQRDVGGNVNNTKQRLLRYVVAAPSCDGSRARVSLRRPSARYHVGRVSRYNHCVLPLMVGVGSIGVGSLTTCRAGRATDHDDFPPVDGIGKGGDAAVETPSWETDYTTTPSPHHPIGAKGGRRVAQCRAYLDEPSAYGVAQRMGLTRQTVKRCLERAAELGWWRRLTTCAQRARPGDHRGSPSLACRPMPTARSSTGDGGSRPSCRITVASMASDSPDNTCRQ